MSMNIKNEEAHRLARQLAKTTGESMATAVTEAMKEKLIRLRRAGGGSRAERLLQIGKECAAALGKEFRNLDHGEFLYDEKGLPK